MRLVFFLNNTRLARISPTSLNLFPVKIHMVFYCIIPFVFLKVMIVVGRTPLCNTLTSRISSQDAGMSPIQIISVFIYRTHNFSPF